ncbi:MAG: glucosaminidase domain-containing protein [Lachnospiraceae bacterium]
MSKIYKKIVCAAVAFSLCVMQIPVYATALETTEATVQTPSEEVTPSPEATATVTPEATASPTETPEPSATAAPTSTPEVTATQIPEETTSEVTPTPTPDATDTPAEVTETTPEVYDSESIQAETYDSVLSFSVGAASASSATQKAFINKIASSAIKSAAKYNIFPSIMMAQAILESGWGQSALALQANNLFGIKGDYNGQSVTMDTQEELEDGSKVTVSAQFRKYPSVLESLNDNGDLIRNGTSWNSSYYSGAWRENAKSYKEAAQGLQGKYATDSGYAAKLINIIETYDLAKYDSQGAFVEVNQKIYYKLVSGSYATGWWNIGGKQYYFSAVASTRGQMFTGFHWISGSRYFFSEAAGTSGQMVTGWRTIKGVRYYFSRASATSGIQLTGFQWINGSRYYFSTIRQAGKYGKLLTGFQWIGGERYYFSKNGTTYGKQLVGWQTINGYRYYLSKVKTVGIYGRVLTGRQKINGVYYYFSPDKATYGRYIRNSL